MPRRRAERPTTDWVEIARLYDAARPARADRRSCELNRAVALAMADGPAAGLELVELLADELGDFRLFHATRADLLRRLDRPRPRLPRTARRSHSRTIPPSAASSSAV